MGAAPSCEGGFSEDEARAWLGVFFDEEAERTFRRHADPDGAGVARVAAARVETYTKKRKWLRDRGQIVMENLRQLRRARQGADRVAGIHLCGLCDDIPDRPGDVWTAADGAHRQADRRGDPCADLHDVYELAEKARYVFEGAVGDALVAAALGESATFDSAPLKPRERAAAKAASEYGARDGAGCAYLLDVVRGSVTCGTEAEVLDVWAALDAALDVVKCKNRFKTPNFNGYRDLVLTVRVECASDRGVVVAHYCELQVHVAALRNAEGVLRSYDVYRYLRAYFGEHDGQRADQEARARVLLAGGAGGGGGDVAGLVDECLGLFDDDAGSLEHLALFLKHVDHGDHVPRLEARLSTVRKSWVDDAAHRRAVAAHLRDDGAFSGDGLTRKSLVAEHHDSRDGAAFETGTNALAVKLMNDGRYRDAEPLLRTAVARFEAELGPEHEHVAAALGNLCLCLREQGRGDEALPLYARALAVDEARLGPAHEDVAATLSGYAGCLRDLGRPDDAVPLYRRSLAIWERHLGPDHGHVAEMLNKLAAALVAAGCRDRRGEPKPKPRPRSPASERGRRLARLAPRNTGLSLAASRHAPAS